MFHFPENGQVGSFDENSEIIFRNKYPLHQYCRDGNVEAVALLIARHSLVEEDCLYGWTPAHWASYFGKLDCLEKILCALPNNISVNLKSSRFLHTPAHAACLAGRSECLLLLLERGADPDLQDYLGETLLHKACRSGNIECINLLIAMGTELSILNNNGQSPSKLALACFHPVISSVLDQAELSNQQTGRLNGINNGFKSFHKKSISKNGFNSSGNNNFSVNYFPSVANEHSCFTNGVSHLPVNSRKRSIDHFDGEVKRIRTEVPEYPDHLLHLRSQTAMTFFNGITAPVINSSILEHNTLRTMEQGYHQAVLDSIISQVHGC